MSELIYLRRYNKIYKGVYRQSLPDHMHQTYRDPALFGGFFGPKPTAIPMSLRLQRYLCDFYGSTSVLNSYDDDSVRFDPELFDPGDFAPEEFMIIAAEAGERGAYPFTTSYYWLTLAKWGNGRRRVDLREAAELLRADRR